MTTLLIIGIAIILLLVMLYAVNSIRKKKEQEELNRRRGEYKKELYEVVRRANDAVHNLDALLAITRCFSDEDERQYRDNYEELREDSARLIHSSFTREFESEVDGIRRFCSRYDTLTEQKKKNNQLYKKFKIVVDKDLLTQAINDMKEWEDCCNYFTESKKDEYLLKYKVVIELVELAKKQREIANALGYELEYPRLTWFYRNIKERKDTINASYIEKELSKNEDYFAGVLRFPLSEQQQNALVLDEDNVLVISSAGSGKTFTMEGKVRYLIDKKGINPASILVLTFTRKAAESLRQRINVEGVLCSTFDALANGIVAQHDGFPPSICDGVNVREAVFHGLLQDEQLVNSIARFLTMYATDAQTELDVDKIEDLVEVRRATDRRTLLPCMDGHVVFTKSEQERIIGDILARNGVQYRYEERYEFNVADLEHQQYRPDFSIYYSVDETYTGNDINGNPMEQHRSIQKRVYLEHFGVDVFDEVPRWFANESQTWEQANQRYHEGITWKRNLHHQRGTVLLETSSADFQLFGPDGVERKILDQLRGLGIPIQPLSSREVYELINASNPQRGLSVKQMLSTFVSLLKEGCRDLDVIINNVRQEYNSYQPNNNRFRFFDRVRQNQEKEAQRNHLRKERDLFILENLVRPYYLKYQEVLKERGEKDFLDVVLEATKYNNSGNNKRYDYILIDEFQDMSIARYKFVQSLRSDNPFNTKLFCVGDDWQSIYRFAGSDLSLFNDFQRFFGYVEKCKIETTYRFGEPLLSLSSRFVMENPSQVEKVVDCLPKSQTEFTCVPYDFDWNNFQVGQRSLYLKISGILDSIPKGEEVCFLGRYGFDADSLRQAGFLVSERGDKLIVKYNNKNMAFLTVHKAKGLEADNVILLNCNDGTYGFPSAIEDDPILSYVLSEQEHFKFGEERRLFYVAITRAKKHTFILYDANRPSYFLKDFINRDEGEYGFCPLCHTGHIVRFQQRTIQNGNRMTEFRCSNERYGCPYRDIQWENRDVRH